MLYSMIWTIWAVLTSIYVLKYLRIKDTKIYVKSELDLSNLSDEEKESLIRQEIQRTFPIVIKKLRNQHLIAAILAFIIFLISFLMIFIEALLGNSISSILFSVSMVLYCSAGINHAKLRNSAKQIEFDGIGAGAVHSN